MKDRELEDLLCSRTKFKLRTVPPPCAKPRLETHDELLQFTTASIDQLRNVRRSTIISTMEDDDGPPMLVSSENVDGAEEANLNAEMADAQIKKVPISIITGE